MLITLEGPDGAGKSVQARLLAERVSALGREVVLTREPGGTELGERIRTVLLQASPGDHDPLSDAFLFNAARSRLVAEVVRPALGRGAVVVCDRYADSTLAYQGYGDGIPLVVLEELADHATGGLKSARTVLIDVPVDIGLARRQSGAAADLTRFEQADSHGVQFHERVRRGYLKMAAAEPDRWRIVDGRGELNEVRDGVWEAVADLFEG